MRRYGIPYRGSKSRIAKEIVENLPAGEVLHDLFCGGCAVTHAEFPVYISEYSMPDDFVCIWSKSVGVLANHLGCSGQVTEGLWLHEKWVDAIPKTTLF